MTLLQAAAWMRPPKPHVYFNRTTRTWVVLPRFYAGVGEAYHGATVRDACAAFQARHS